MTDAPTKRTPLYQSHLDLDGRMVPFGGWEMPLHYGRQLEEHQAVREKAGVFDVSHMGQVRMRGEKALAFLDRMVPGRVGKLGDGD